MGFPENSRKVSKAFCDFAESVSPKVNKLGGGLRPYGMSVAAEGGKLSNNYYYFFLWS